MQSLTRPQDAEWLLAQEITRLAHVDASANQSTNITGKKPYVWVFQTGCTPVTSVSWQHDFSIDIWAGKDDDYSQVTDVALTIAGYLASLSLQSGEYAWHAPDVMNMYPNPDPQRPHVPRVTLTYSVQLRGESIDF